MTPKLVWSDVCLKSLLRTTCAIDHDAHAFAIGLVTDIDDALDRLLANELGDLLDQPGFVDLIRNLGDDNRRLVALLRLFELRLGPQQDRSATGSEGIHDALVAHDEAAGGKVRSPHEAKKVAEPIVACGQALAVVTLFGRLL